VVTAVGVYAKGSVATAREHVSNAPDRPATTMVVDPIG